MNCFSSFFNSNNLLSSKKVCVDISNKFWMLVSICSKPFLFNTHFGCVEVERSICWDLPSIWLYIRIKSVFPNLMNRNDNSLFIGCFSKSFQIGIIVDGVVSHICRNSFTSLCDSTITILQIYE